MPSCLKLERAEKLASPPPPGFLTIPSFSLSAESDQPFPAYRKGERFVAAAWLQDKQSAIQYRPTTDLKKSKCMCHCR
jgi:hypothetical protein